LWQIELAIEQGLSMRTGVGQEDTNLDYHATAPTA
jgi:hypothetical protein